MSQTGLGCRRLADLAFDDESRPRLRDTLQVFPRAGRYTVTADRLSLHKNGVEYRIRKAEESLGGRIDDCRADPRAGTASANILAMRYFGH
jgi:DNA-binding PucR family transcriptional regulator